MYTMHDAWLAG